MRDAYKKRYVHIEPTTTKRKVNQMDMENQPWCYYGAMIPKSQYDEYKRIEGFARCPLCGRQNLTENYASKKKHIIKCLKLKGMR